MHKRSRASIQFNAANRSRASDCAWLTVMNRTQHKAAALRFTGTARIVFVMTFSFRHACAVAAIVPIPENNVIQIWAIQELAIGVTDSRIDYQQ
jgi:hypothetical protein